MNHSHFRRVFALPLLAMFAAIGTGGLTSCAPKASAPQASPPVSAAVATAVSHDVPEYLNADGQTTAFQSVNIVSQVEGQIVAMPFTQGSFVKKGDLLAKVDAAPYAAAVSKAAGQVVTDRANLDLAKAQVERSKQLLTDKYISQQQYDGYVAQVDALTGQLQVDQAQLDAANINLGYTNITAPIDGMVGTYMINLGNVVKANDQPITTIQNMDPIYADFSISESDFPNLHERFDANGGKLKVIAISLAANNTQTEGELSILGNAIAAPTGTVGLRAVLPNAKHAFWPNQPVRVRILLQTIPQAVLVPEGAIMLSQQGEFVFVVDPPKGDAKMPTAEKRVVQTGPMQDDGMKVITSGLKPGEQVVVEGAQMMLVPGASLVVAEIDGKPVGPPPGASPAAGAAGSAPAASASTNATNSATTAK